MGKYFIRWFLFLILVATVFPVAVLAEEGEKYYFDFQLVKKWDEGINGARVEATLVEYHLIEKGENYRIYAYPQSYPLPYIAFTANDAWGNAGKGLLIIYNYKEMAQKKIELQLSFEIPTEDGYLIASCSFFEFSEMMRRGTHDTKIYFDPSKGRITQMSYSFQSYE